MNRRKVILLLAVVVSSLSVAGQKPIDTKQPAVKIADRILSETPYVFVDKATGKTYKSLKNAPFSMQMKAKSQYNDWHYTNGVLHIALMELADKLQDKKYEEYVYKNMEFVFDPANYAYFKRQFEEAFRENGWRGVRRTGWHMIFRNKRLDDNGPMGASLIDLQKRQPRSAFLDYIHSTRDHLMDAEPRLADGTIARIWPHENTIWADDLFMAVSFLCRMGELTGDRKYYDDAANQVLRYNHYLWCPEKKIYYHCYHTDTKEHGVAHWSRANGWVIMAQADLLSRLPEDHPQRQALLDNFRQQISGVVPYQSASGLWRQLLDKPDSYEEITGTAMFVFAIAKGVKKGWLHPDYIYIAHMGVKGMMSKITDKGDVTAICPGTGIAPSISFYYNRGVQTNTPMGEGPVLRALVEMMDAPAYTEISADDQYDKIK